MGIEIERQYLVRGDAWRSQIARAVRMHQGYFRSGPEATVRVRLVEPVDGAPSTAEPTGVFTIKGVPSGGVRPEFEYTIPPDDVEQMLDLFCGDRTVTKVRHAVDHAGHRWVVDEFEGANHGLVMAEIELDAPDEDFADPEWLGDEVTDDGSYTNAALARRPISER